MSAPEPLSRLSPVLGEVGEERLNPTKFQDTDSHPLLPKFRQNWGTQLTHRVESCDTRSKKTPTVRAVMTSIETPQIAMVIRSCSGRGAVIPVT